MIFFPYSSILFIDISLSIFVDSMVCVCVCVSLSVAKFTVSFFAIFLALSSTVIITNANELYGAGPIIICLGTFILSHIYIYIFIFLSRNHFFINQVLI